MESINIKDLNRKRCDAHSPHNIFTMVHIYKKLSFVLLMVIMGCSIMAFVYQIYHNHASYLMMSICCGISISAYFCLIYGIYYYNLLIAYPKKGKNPAIQLALTIEQLGKYLWTDSKDNQFNQFNQFCNDLYQRCNQRFTNHYLKIRNDLIYFVPYVIGMVFFATKRFSDQEALIGSLMVCLIIYLIIQVMNDYIQLKTLKNDCQTLMFFLNNPKNIPLKEDLTLIYPILRIWIRSQDDVFDHDRASSKTKLYRSTHD